MIDYHIHPAYSIDADGTLEEFCEAAISRGIRDIAFTTHLDTDPQGDDFYVVINGERWDIRRSDWLEIYEQDIRNIGDKYEGQGLEVRLGIEVDIYPEVMENLPERFFSTDFDIVIGSVHLIDHLAISIRQHAEVIFRKYTPEQMAQMYYSKLIDGVGMPFVDVLGHIDIYRRFGRDIYGDVLDSIWMPFIDELADKMNRHNVAFEINTSSWRKGQKEPMPSREIIHALFSKGVSMVTIGSDAHIPQHVGFRVMDAMTLARDAGARGIPNYEKHR